MLADVDVEFAVMIRKNIFSNICGDVETFRASFLVCLHRYVCFPECGPALIHIPIRLRSVFPQRF